MNVFARHCVVAALVVAVSVGAGILSVSAADAATTYVVDNTSTACSDAGPGTPSLPFCTIDTAAKRAVAGDTVLVRAGKYTGTSVNPVNSGTATAPITFTAGPGVTITGGKSAFALSGRSNIVISGFTVAGTSSHGIAVSGGGNVVVSHNTVSLAGAPEPGLTAAGIYVKDLAGGRVLANISHNNSSHGVELTGSTTHVRVQGNRSYRNAEQYIRNATGIDVTSPGNTIVQNVTYANEDSGINIYPGAGNTVVAENVTYDNGDHGIDNLNASGDDITGNTVFYNCTAGIEVEGTSQNVVIENNVSVNNATGAIINPTPINPPGAYANKCNRRVGNIGVYDSASATTRANFNLVWQTGTSAEYVWAGRAYRSRRLLHRRTGQETRGIFANPKFRNAAKWNLHLSWNSPAIDSADSNARGEMLTDILGRPRADDRRVPNTGVGRRKYDDRGAYEYQPRKR